MLRFPFLASGEGIFARDFIVERFVSFWSSSVLRSLNPFQRESDICSMEGR